MATTFLVVKNDAVSTLASGVDDAVTTWTVAAGEGASFPSTYPFHVSCEDEIASCTSRTTDALTVVRAQQGTAAASHTSGMPVELLVTAKSITDLNTAVNTLESAVVLKTLFDANNTILKADVADTPESLTVAEQRLVGRITDGVITALTGAQVMALLSGQAGAAFDWNAQNLTNLGDIGANDDKFITFGGVAKLGWETADANSHKLILALPDNSAGDNESPQFFIGNQSILNLDLGHGRTAHPTFGVVDYDGDTWVSLTHVIDDYPYLMWYGAGADNYLEIGPDALRIHTATHVIFADRTYTDPSAISYGAYFAGRGINTTGSKNTHILSGGLFNSGCPAENTGDWQDIRGGVGTINLIEPASGSYTVDKASMLYSYMLVGASVTLTAAHGLYIKDPTNAGTITTLYGVYVEDMTEGGTNYAIHTGAGLVHFGDNLEMASGKTVDGTDISAHVADMDAHQPLMIQGLTLVGTDLYIDDTAIGLRQVQLPDAYHLEFEDTTGEVFYVAN